MEKALAKHVVVQSFRAVDKITSLVPLLKEHCSEEEYRALALAIARSAANIKSEMIDLVYARYPEIEEEVDRDIERYERVL
ncbi:hypothetical protein [Dongia sp.]|uniref:hypothetical protein n=1 Tax=Dongia sp. TaxID=1977262 RepID=UPI0035AE8C79